MQLLKDTIDLRHVLNNCAEKSMHEVRTKENLINWIKAKTSDNPNYEIIDLDRWFYVRYKSDNVKRKAIAFRADMDAVTINEHEVRHLCGHDGHSATLAGFCVLINGHKLDRDVYFIFQHAEESGDGGKECAELILIKEIEEVYAYHNIPGFKEGECLLKDNTFACASSGILINFKGAVSHAAYPELGKNPSFALAKVINYIEAFNQKERDYIEFATIVGSKMGNESYGVSCGDASLMMTVRSEIEMNLIKLIDDIQTLCAKLAIEYGLTYQFELKEPFPSTVNTSEEVTKLAKICKINQIDCQYLDTPFRWSEDFGHYLKYAKGALFGIGNGLNSSGLHTDEYSFNDNIIVKVWLIFASLL